jgi:hypothetical protein
MDERRRRTTQPPLTEEERRRLEIIASSRRTPQDDVPLGWREPDPEHPGLVGEARARMETQRRRRLVELLRSDAVGAHY